jgi:hypothetical protein
MMKMTFLGPEAEGRRFSLRQLSGRCGGFFCAVVLFFSCELYTQPGVGSTALSVAPTTVQDDNTLSELSILPSEFGDLGVLTFKNESGEWVDLTESNFDEDIKEYKLNLNIGRTMTVIVARANNKDADVTFKMNDQTYKQGIFRNLPPARGVINIVVTPKNGEENIYTINLDRTVLDVKDFNNEEDTALKALDDYLKEVNGLLDEKSTVGTIKNPLPIRARGLTLTNPQVFASQPVFKGDYNLYLDLDLSDCTVGTPIEDNETKYIFYRIDKNIIRGIEYIVRFMLPEAVIQIADEETDGAGVFGGYTNQRDIYLPGVKKIGKYAFSLNTSLKTIQAPEVEEIEKNAFASCINITTIDMPKLTTIAENTFSSCIQLKSFSAPKLTNIGNKAFAACYALSELKLGGGGDWTAVGDFIFDNLPDACLKQIRVYDASGINAVPVVNNETYWGSTHKDKQVSSLAQEIAALSHIPWSPPENP